VEEDGVTPKMGDALDAEAVMPAKCGDCANNPLWLHASTRECVGTHLA